MSIIFFYKNIFLGLVFLMIINLTFANKADAVEASSSMKPLDDLEMSKETGQVLFNLQYLAPRENNNPNPNVGFYRLSMEAKLDINANAKQIQLGCGGVKGRGCDIDITNVSLTGVNPVNGSFAASDATFQNPFYEFAIRNPDSASLREFVGIRLGAESVLGLLSIGTNPDPTDLSDDSGINSLSGDISLTVTNSKLSNGCVRLLVCLPFTGTLSPHTQTVVANRASTIDLVGLQATTTSIVGFPLGLSLNNINVLNQPLRSVHQLLLATDEGGTIPTKDFSLSLQSIPLTWQKGSTQDFNGVQAQPGWWLSLPQLRITGLDIKQSVEVPAGDVIGGLLFSNPIYLNPIDLAQKPAKNCYGGLTFC